MHESWGFSVAWSDVMSHSLFGLVGPPHIATGLGLLRLVYDRDQQPTTQWDGTSDASYRAANCRNADFLVFAAIITVPLSVADSYRIS
jgi:hypothetical protein